MLRTSIALLGLATLVSVTATSTAAATDCPDLLDHRFRTLAERHEQVLCEQYNDQVLLVVNTASFCGFTPQYESLAELYQRYRDRGMSVLGFPSDDFAQEPGTEEEIRDFCELTYGVEFPMFEKTHVRGEQAHPFYRQLATISGTAPGWNFHKYLIARDGRTVMSFSTRVSPDDPTLIEALESLL